MFDELTQKEKNAVKEMAKVLIDYSSESQMQKILDNLELLETLSYQFGERIEPFDEEELEYHEYYTFEDTIELVKKFLGTIDPEYPVKFDELLNDGTINLYHIDDEEYVDIYGEDAFCIEDDIIRHDDNGTIIGFEKRRDINVPLQHTLDDAYSLIHEFIHYTNIPNGIEYSDDRDILTESSSFIFECLFNKYLIDNGYSKEEADINLKMRINTSIELAESVNGIAGVLLYMREYPDYIKEAVPYDKEDSSEYEAILDEIDYFLAGVISLMAYKNYLDGKIDIKNIKDFNNALEFNNNLESLIFLFGHGIEECDSEQICEDISLIINDLGFSKKIK